MDLWDFCTQFINSQHFWNTARLAYVKHIKCSGPPKNKNKK